MNKESNRISTKGMAMIIIIAVLLVDQLTKIWVKTHMHLHECIDITGWFKILFVENNGMAYGMELLGGKLVLSLFRIVAISVLAYYLYKEVKRNANRLYVACVAMVWAGAVGNLIDSVFYGMIFNAASPFYVSYFVPFGQGYAPMLMGKVVDMLHFPLIETHYPEWVPWVGGNEFVFFSPVFNVADACISVGFVMALLFCRDEIAKISLFKHVDDNNHSQTKDK
ncbi:MAG: lipoprotein signal peptidase [Prevotellaceae bacterium]|nr:lipoprotein signal peptidase [Prevotella sp.]MDD6818176.1 lipoprotein signal peptidase [Prevotellaceae bacterium]MDD6843055.1 lipoprotein signal peptidase [Prevotellaceae bacterium]MDD6977621.1 lipoprotein signal peptidase [Prevotellaceae bacterium]MDY5005046.1 lipoprotein signal peptidase [Prevotella sp.]